MILADSMIRRWHGELRVRGTFAVLWHVVTCGHLKSEIFKVRQQYMKAQRPGLIALNETSSASTFWSSRMGLKLNRLITMLFAIKKCPIHINVALTLKKLRSFLRNSTYYDIGADSSLWECIKHIKSHWNIFLLADEFHHHTFISASVWFYKVTRGQ